MYKRILFLGAGSCIGPEFIKRIKKVPGVELVVAVDSDRYASGFAVADFSEVVPKAVEPGFVQSIQKIVEKYNIDYVFPFIEFGQKQLMEVKANFGSDLIAGALCKDKCEFYKKCKEVGLPVPKTYLLSEYREQLSFPVYVKPRAGDGSKENYKIENKDELLGVRYLYQKRKDGFLVQEFLNGQHWAADVVVEDGEVVTVVTRKTLGKVYQIEVVDKKSLKDFCVLVQSKLKINKIFNIEVFEVEKDKFVINEINARAGGNCIASCLAGCDIISYLITLDKKYLNKPENKILAYGFERFEIKK